MKELYIVAELMGGYDGGLGNLVGVFTDKNAAEYCASLTGDEYEGIASREMVVAMLLESADEIAAAKAERDSLFARVDAREKQRKAHEDHFAGLARKKAADDKAVEEAQKRIAEDPELARQILKG